MDKRNEISLDDLKQVVGGVSLAATANRQPPSRKPAPPRGGQVNQHGSMGGSRVPHGGGFPG